MSRNFRLTIAYDGGNYLGWQDTSEGPSIEKCVRTNLEKILQHHIVLQAAGRTDAGVHANAQEANFFTQNERVEPQKILFSLNGLLPKDIRILHVYEEGESFHPTLDCTGKQYLYQVCYGNVQLPNWRNYSWHFPSSLDLDSMREGAKFLIGFQDYAAFTNSKKNEIYESTVREVSEIAIHDLPGERLRFEITGNRFLYKMVRNIVGTLVYVGAGKIRVDALKGILCSKDRTNAGVTAPSKGLFLHKVLYRMDNSGS